MLPSRYFCQTPVDLPAFPLPAGKTDESLFRLLCEQGLIERYGNLVPQEARDRLDYEMRTIEDRGIARLFLIVREYLDWARSQGIGVGPGRTCASGSTAAYVLGITDIDPIEHAISTELFVEYPRDWPFMPSITASIEHERFREVRQHVASRYGEDALPVMFPLIRGWLMGGFAPYAQGDLDLSVRAVGIISRTCRAIEKRARERIDLEDLPLDDEAAFEMLRQDGVQGLVDLGRGAGEIRSAVLKRIAPRSLSDVAATVALSRDTFERRRPEALGDYVRAKSGEAPLQLDGRFLPILQETGGIILYRDQIVQLGMQGAGFPPAQAVKLSKAAAKGNLKLLDTLRQPWCDGARALGCPPDEAERMWNQIATPFVSPFKVKSVEIAVLFVRAAFLQAHYPDDYRKALYPL